MRIACVSIPRFTVEAERQRRKNIGARLILIGECVVLDCSLGAEVSKVKRGMRLSEAIGLCPRAIVLAPDQSYYERLFGEVLDSLETLSPAVQAGETGVAYAALDGLPTPPKRWADEAIALLHKRLGFMPSVGIAQGKFAAKVAATVSRAGAQKIVPAGEEAAFLAPLALDHLPASDAIRWRLAMLGMATIGEVARLPLSAMQAQFGTDGRRIWELAHGTDEEPLVSRIQEQTVMRRLQLPSPAITLDVIAAGVEKLVLAATALWAAAQQLAGVGCARPSFARRWMAAERGSCLWPFARRYQIPVTPGSRSRTLLKSARPPARWRSWKLN